MSAPLARLAKPARLLAALALIAFALPANGQDWGATATISNTMGVHDGRICTGEASRSDLGCALNAPYVSRTTGYLGIGTTQPSAAVHVLGTGQVRLYDSGAVDFYRPLDTSNSIFQIWSDAGGTPWSSILRVTTDGRTALNFRNGTSTTPPPSTTLHINGSIRVAAEASSTLNTCDTNRTGAIKFQTGEFYVCRNGSSWETLAAASGGGASGDRIISGTTQAIAYQNTSLSLVTAGTERVVIGTNGNIGINQQPAANAELSVSASNVAFTNLATTTSASVALSLQAAGSNGGGFSAFGSNFSAAWADPRTVELAAFGGTSALQFRTSQNAHDIPFVFKMGSTNIKEVARITSTGLAIGGIITPTTEIDVSGTTTTTSLRLRELAGAIPNAFQGGFWQRSGSTIYYNGGRVGIGTTAPEKNLHITSPGPLAGIMIERTSTDTGSPVLVFRKSRGADPIVLNDPLAMIYTQSVLNSSGAFRDNPMIAAYATENHNATGVGYRLAFRTTPNGTLPSQERMSINQNGYVGIGTDAPHSNLTIQSNSWPTLSLITTVAAQDSKIQLAHNTTDGDAGWTIRRDGDLSDQFQLRYNNATNLRFTTAGVLTITGTNTCVIGNGTGATSCTSDKRLKTDIQPLQNSLEKIIAMQGVHFKWKSDKSKTRIGLIAQDVEKIFPELVTTDEASGMKMVDYASVVAPLIESVKILDTQNKALEAKNTALEARLQRIEQTLAKHATDK